MTHAPHPASLTVRAPAAIGLSAGGLREMVSRLNPALRVGRVRSLEQMYWQRRSFDDTFGLMVGAATVIVLLFSMAGMYTLMAFIVAQRWHEIGVRAALGASPRRLLIGIFGRAAIPLLIGALAGCAIALRLHYSIADHRDWRAEYSGRGPSVGRIDDRDRSACGGRTGAARHSHRPDRGAAAQLKERQTGETESKSRHHQGRGPRFPALSSILHRPVSNGVRRPPHGLVDR